MERKVRTMEKINKEELMKKLNLTEEELEKVMGGSSGVGDTHCFTNCVMECDADDNQCPIQCMKECTHS